MGVHCDTKITVKTDKCKGSNCADYAFCVNTEDSYQCLCDNTWGKRNCKYGYPLHLMDRMLN